MINTSISMQQDARTCFSTFLPVLCGDDPSVRWGHHLRSIFACIRSCTANHAKNKKKIEKQHQSKLRFEKKEWGKGITKSKATEIPYKWKNVDVNLPLSYLFNQYMFNHSSNHNNWEKKPTSVHYLSGHWGILSIFSRHKSWLIFIAMLLIPNDFKQSFGVVNADRQYVFLTRLLQGPWVFMYTLLTCWAVWEMTGKYWFAEDIETLTQIKGLIYIFLSNPSHLSSLQIVTRTMKQEP